MSSLDLEAESVSELGAGPSGSNGVEALQLLEHEQGKMRLSIIPQAANNYLIARYTMFACKLTVQSRE